MIVDDATIRVALFEKFCTPLANAEDVQVALGTYSCVLGFDGQYRRFIHVGVKGTTKAAIGGHHYNAGTFHRALLAVGCAGIALQVGEDVAQHRVQFISIRPQLLDRSLGSTQLGRRNHFHGFGDLLRVHHRLDPLTNLF